MKKLLLLILFVPIGKVVADDFKVLFVNDKDLKFVNGKNIKIGDIFSDVRDINWEREKQAVKAINMVTKKQTLFVGREWVKKTGINALLHEKHLSTHDKQGEEESFYDKLHNVFDDQYNLLDSIEIDSDIELSDSCYFQVTYDYNDTKQTKNLKNKGNTIVIDKTLFHIEEEQLEPQDIIISIDLVDDRTGIIIFVKDDIELNIYPEELQ